MKFENFPEPVYEGEFNESALVVLEAGNYAPIVAKQHDAPEKKIIGINGVVDCIGIVAWTTVCP